MKNKPKFIYLQTGLEDNAEMCEDFNELSGISWCDESVYSDDLQFISCDFIKSFLDPAAFNNRNVWEDDEYLEENYPVQYLIKKLLQ